MRVLPVESQCREPATGDLRIATRRAGWRPFDAPDGSTLVRSTRRGSRGSRLPMRPVISQFSTGWQDGRDAFGCGHGPSSSCHPVILSEISPAVPVLDPGLRMTEPDAQGQRETNSRMEAGSVFLGGIHVLRADKKAKTREAAKNEIHNAHKPSVLQPFFSASGSLMERLATIGSTTATWP